jgi:hypothetical protein
MGPPLASSTADARQPRGSGFAWPWSTYPLAWYSTTLDPAGTVAVWAKRWFRQLPKVAEPVYSARSCTSVAPGLKTEMPVVPWKSLRTSGATRRELAISTGTPSTL